MIKYFLFTSVVLLMYYNSWAQVDQLETMRQTRILSYHQPMVLKTRRALKEKWKHGYIVNIQNDTVECILTVKGKKYFIEHEDESIEVEATEVKVISYLDLEEGNVVLHSFPFQRNNGVERHFFKASYKDTDFLLVRNDEKIVEELICMDENDYLRGHYFLDLENETLIPVSRNNLFLLTAEFDTEIKQFVEQENNRLKKEWDFIEVLLYYQSLKYPGQD